MYIVVVVLFVSKARERTCPLSCHQWQEIGVCRGVYFVKLWYQFMCVLAEVCVLLRYITTIVGVYWTAEVC